MENTMATNIRFDKLRFVKKLKESGQPEDQAEALADAFDEALTQSQSPLATKQDLLVLKQELTESMYKMAGFIIIGVGAIMGLLKFIN